MERGCVLEATYKRRLSQSYMILEHDCEWKGQHELEMLSYQRMPGFLPIETEISDGILRFWYEITGKQSLADSLERHPIEMALLDKLLGALEQACQMTQNYLLEESGILLEAEYIYLDFGQEKVEFTYLPGWGGDIQDGFQRLMEQILQRLDHDDKQAIAVAYEIYQRSLQRDSSLQDLMKCRKEIHGTDVRKDLDARESQLEGMIGVTTEEMEDTGPSKEGYQADRKLTGEKYQADKELQKEKYRADKELLKEKYQTDKELPREKYKIGRELPNLKKGIPVGWKKILGQRQKEELPCVVQPEDVISLSKETVYPTELLQISKGTKGILVYQGIDGLPDLKIDKPAFFIGKKAAEVDGFIDMQCISRIHAKIEMEQGEYYVEDMNSTNGTFLNEEPLEYRQRVQLKERDRISFGSVEYLFL